MVVMTTLFLFLLKMNNNAKTNSKMKSNEIKSPTHLLMEYRVQPQASIVLETITWAEEKPSGQGAACTNCTIAFYTYGSTLIRV